MNVSLIFSLLLAQFLSPPTPEEKKCEGLDLGLTFFTNLPHLSNVLCWTESTDADWLNIFPGNGCLHATIDESLESQAYSLYASEENQNNEMNAAESCADLQTLLFSKCLVGSAMQMIFSCDTDAHIMYSCNCGQSS